MRLGWRKRELPSLLHLSSLNFCNKRLWLLLLFIKFFHFNKRIQKESMSESEGERCKETRDRGAEGPRHAAADSSVHLLLELGMWSRSLWAPVPQPVRKHTGFPHRWEAPGWSHPCRWLPKVSDENHGSGALCLGPILTLPPTHCVTLSKVTNSSVLQFPHLFHGENNNVYLLWEST